MHKFSALISGIFIFTLCLAGRAVAAEESKDAVVVQDGMLVSLQYTLRGEDGQLIESNQGKEPLGYVQGRHMVIPGLEKELTGMKVGQEKHIVVQPEEAYGPVNPNAIQEVPKDKVPVQGQHVGAVLTATTPQGMPIPVRVKEVKENTVVLDFNHPMAGKTLVFDIKVLNIQAAPPQAASPSPSAGPAKPTATQ